jgi:hypothetical protein
MMQFYVFVMRGLVPGVQEQVTTMRRLMDGQIKSAAVRFSDIGSG